ncbi:Xaa-Pro aminopeptidase [Pseudoclavibacter endophyticus]|uniref:Xaa-Pro aminopeptidase n=1 Tax=Pseudoclavibacter endophyticus TaxID=1778590 RepID=A0A6H9WSW0_9MICO|nr:aminopeptidase P family protein [Pseudoclavibacter endophyticus]KAB1649775.1 aminopeptidase P family protein [Pseudoclavibacter endophyticus]GGA59832.1 Xaa-Pro aminopeptidase [Pseudoclavibacter endophyticus]
MDTSDVTADTAASTTQAEAPEPPRATGQTSATEQATSTEQVSVPAHSTNRSTTPRTAAFQQRISLGWAERDEPLPPRREAAPSAAVRRRSISSRFVGERIVVPAGTRKQRSNDTDYPFRAHSAFSHLTGWGSDAEPGAVLVLEPSGTAHTATLYFRERAGRESDEFYANPDIGEFWIGPRPSLAQVAADLDIPTEHLDRLNLDRLNLDEDGPLRVVREADPELTARLDAARGVNGDESMSSAVDELEISERMLADVDRRAKVEAADAELEQALSELRLVKDEFEIGELRKAVAATASGFDDIVGSLRRATTLPRGERLIEGVFHTRARLEGNEVGYDTIAASGHHACILHWTKNSGEVRDGDLVLIDAGVEVDSLYTADITRTLPVNGTFTEPQRRVYQAVLDAADAAFAVVKPGITFRDVHETAMRVIAQRTAEWGLLGVTADEALARDGQQHRRYMVHGTSHHLGIDVHDCAKARRELYLDGVVEAGMVFTIEPGLYFQPDDLTVPDELRGIGVRIEDDVLVTADGAENLSIAIPRAADDVESWLRRGRRAD